MEPKQSTEIRVTINGDATAVHNFFFFPKFLLHIISGRTSCEYSLAPNVILVLETFFFLPSSSPLTTSPHCTAVYLTKLQSVLKTNY